jgi:hypothetical protein
LAVHTLVAHTLVAHTLVAILILLAVLISLVVRIVIFRAEHLLHHHHQKEISKVCWILTFSAILAMELLTFLAAFIIRPPYSIWL